ncbi:hypothetical protein KZ686_11670 [Cupriavidus cauae]|uniref:hypothetical protein n=1 Tax=Cupriavidus cauae TaxID=2608999 RepID=UPI0022431313|nr:hypothetical protein [Cupriavidus cauae]UZN48441.1 hypothetical protein KZ686_11670 [Cupriavidus cauae]
MNHDPVVIEQAEITGWQTISKGCLIGDTPLRKELLLGHPALSGAQPIRTPMAEKMYKELRDSILVGEPGTYFVGERGDGRSAALRICAQVLEHEYPQIASYHHASTAMSNSNEKVAMQAMLASVGHGVLSGGPVVLRERLIAKVVDDLRRRGTGHIALWLVDNAHNMQQAELQMLADVQERLWDSGVQLVTAMMTNDDEGWQRSAHGAARSTFLSRRFFAHAHKLRGVVKPDDVSEILDQFDTRDFPRGTDVRWTEFFLPRAYQNGLRLAGEGPALYGALTQCSAHPDKRPATLDVLFGAVRGALLNGTHYDRPEFRFTPGSWKQAVSIVQMQNFYVPPRLPGCGP